MISSSVSLWHGLTPPEPSSSCETISRPRGPQDHGIREDWAGRT
jgi:hypothetical protein